MSAQPRQLNCPAPSAVLPLEQRSAVFLISARTYRMLLPLKSSECQPRQSQAC
jgi:hypothetical protein